MRAPDFWTSHSAQAKTCAVLLSPLGAAYALSVRLRQVRSRPYRPNARVICIGNLPAGGSGKTPVELAIAERLAPSGKTGMLSKGYCRRPTGSLPADAPSDA